VDRVVWEPSADDIPFAKTMIFKTGAMMFKARLVLIVIICSLSWLGAENLEWGLKYGIGTSSLQGADRDYQLRYDITQHGVTPGDLGYIVLRSNDRASGVSQAAGVYLSTMLFRKTDSIRLKSELIWQRFQYEQVFKDVTPAVSSPVLAARFSDALRGSVLSKVDYLALPVLISFNQELAEEQKEKSYQGAFIYGGPSFSLLLKHDAKAEAGIQALDQRVRLFTQESATDGDPSSYYTYQRRNSGSDDFVKSKTDLVLGAGFALKDVFQFGIGKDEFIFDLRYTLSLNDLGDGDARNALRLNSFMFNVSCKL
jgi:hypothetical protein